MLRNQYHIRVLRGRRGSFLNWEIYPGWTEGTIEFKENSRGGMGLRGEKRMVEIRRFIPHHIVAAMGDQGGGGRLPYKRTANGRGKKRGILKGTATRGGRNSPRLDGQGVGQGKIRR